MVHPFGKLLPLLFFLPLYSLSQNDYTFQHLTVEDGLLSNPYVNGFQASDGFYWFSGASGIQSFDGKNFVTYKYVNHGVKNSGERIGRPIEDKDKNIWVVNDQGINIFKKVNKVFTRLYLSDAPDSNRNNVSSVLIDSRDVLWIITNKHLFRYDYHLKAPVLFATFSNDPDLAILGATLDNRTNKFWLLLFKNNFYGVASFDGEGKHITYLANKDVTKLLRSYSPIGFFKMDETSNLWIANFKGDFCKYNTVKDELVSYPVLQQQNEKKKASEYSAITDMYDDGNGTVWFGGENVGLLQFDKERDSFLPITRENNSGFGLQYDEKIFSIFKDREGNIWVDTDIGMNIFNPHLQQFKYLSQSKNPGLTQSTGNITSIFESSSKEIWVSTWGNGVFKYDSNFILRNDYVHEKGNSSSFGEPKNRAWAFGEDDQGKIWVGSQYGMLSVLDEANGRFDNKDVPAFEHLTVMHITKDKKRNFWFGLYNGTLGKWNATADSISVYKYPYGDNLKEPAIIDGIYTDNRDDVWLATSIYGLTRFNEAEKRMDEKAMFPQHIFSPVSLNDSVIIGGTLENGLFFYNKLTKKDKFINTADGLSSDKVFGGIADNLNNVWIIASNGIERLDQARRKIYHYDLNDGIKDHVFANAFCRLKNGICMVATNSGIILFNPDSIKQKPPPPDVVITNFNANQRSYSVDSFLQNRGIELSHDQNVIAFEFAAISFIGRNTDQYFYQLKGIDRDWISAGTRRSVTYANLASGKYTFNVRSKNADGVDSKHTTSVEFTIHPAWWRTWWAWLVWICSAIAVVYVAYAYRKRNREAVSTMRKKIASDLHDDIGSTLNSISVYSEIASKQMETNAENTRSLLEKMGIASRNMIDTMNDIVWAVNPKNDYFENILSRMQYFAAELLSGKDILFHFTVDEKTKNIRLSMGKRKNVYLIFKESVTNAYKYSHGKTVTVSIGLQLGDLVMSIVDDGDGFEIKDRTGAGNGLKNMKARAKEINARLEISGVLMQGTRIELRVPV